MNDLSEPILLEAPAKINLGLEVLRRRQDGYHDINTVFAAITLGDRVRLGIRTDGAILCSVPAMPRLQDDPTNLCVRAALALRKIAGDDRLGLDVLLDKRIPVGAGLGGGSSDAAAVLTGANSLWKLGLSTEDLTAVASELGSDVPFFLRGGVAVGTSRGEVLEPVDLVLPFHLLLLFPGIHVSTPWAYKAVGRTGERPITDLAALLGEGIEDPRILREKLVNDFEEAVFREHPVLGELKTRLYEAGALYAAMSGSGSTIFGLFAGAPDALRAAGAFADVSHETAGFQPALSGM